MVESYIEHELTTENQKACENYAEGDGTSWSMPAFTGENKPSIKYQKGWCWQYYAYGRCQKKDGAGCPYDHSVYLPQEERTRLFPKKGKGKGKGKKGKGKGKGKDKGKGKGEYKGKGKGYKGKKSDGKGKGYKSHDGKGKGKAMAFWNNDSGKGNHYHDPNKGKGKWNDGKGKGQYGKGKWDHSQSWWDGRAPRKGDWNQGKDSYDKGKGKGKGKEKGKGKRKGAWQEQGDMYGDARKWVDRSNSAPPRGKSPSGQWDKGVCRNYLKFRCKFGDSCNNYHPPACRDWKKNNCWLGGKCNFLHGDKPHYAAPAAEVPPQQQQPSNQNGSIPGQ